MTSVDKAAQGYLLLNYSHGLATISSSKTRIFTANASLHLEENLSGSRSKIVTSISRTEKKPKKERNNQAL